MDTFSVHCKSWSCSGILPKENNPWKRFVLSKCSHILLEIAIINLKLSTCLWMVSTSHSQLCFAQLKQSSPKCTNKKWVKIKTIEWRNTWCQTTLETNNSATFDSIKVVGRAPKCEDLDKWSTTSIMYMESWDGGKLVITFKVISSKRPPESEGVATNL